MNEIDETRHFYTCDCRSCKKFWFKKQSIENRRLKREKHKERFRKGWIDTYDLTGPWGDRVAVKLFMIGGIATAIGLI